MIKSEYYGKNVRIFDVDGQEWRGKVKMITPSADSDSEENEIAIEFAGGLVNFLESEIEEIEEIFD